MADAQAERQAKLAAAGWAQAPLGTAMGFVATKLSEARPLRREDATPDLLADVARYVVAASPGALTVTEQRAAWDRLAAFLPWNTQLALGEEAGQRAKAILETARQPAPAASVPAYGDGRLAPHEWLRASDGRVIKSDCTGHEWDHTCVGRQSIAWDLAGALCEWGGDPGADAILLDAFRAAGGPDFHPLALDVHRMAYAAFWLGMCSMATTNTPDPSERRRLERRETVYRQQLTRLTAG
jgi:hypothetical protein